MFENRWSDQSATIQIDVYVAFSVVCAFIWTMHWFIFHTIWRFITRFDTHSSSLFLPLFLSIFLGLLIIYRCSSSHSIHFRYFLGNILFGPGILLFFVRFTSIFRFLLFLFKRKRSFDFFFDSVLKIIIKEQTIPF